MTSYYSFRHPETNNFCSKCFKELNKDRVDPEITTANSTISASTSTNIEALTNEVKSIGELLETGIEPIVTQPAKDSSSSRKIKTPKKSVNRCSTCSKRVGYLGFTCRCGLLLCGQHRYSDSHSCTYDYKSSAKEILRESNPALPCTKLKDRI